MLKYYPQQRYLPEHELHQKINEIRSKMIIFGLQYGLSHPRTVEFSQKLDMYLNECQKR